MTKTFIRSVAGKTFEIVYPQAGDSINQTYKSDAVHYFFEYMEKIPTLVPNDIAVYGNRDADGGWGNIRTGTAEDAAEKSKYITVLEPFLAASLASQSDLDDRAAAILSKVTAEHLIGIGVIPHDASMELYDKVKVYRAKRFLNLSSLTYTTFVYFAYKNSSGYTFNYV